VGKTRLALGSHMGSHTKRRRGQSTKQPAPQFPDTAAKAHAAEIEAARIREEAGRAREEEAHATVRDLLTTQLQAQRAESLAREAATRASAVAREKVLADEKREATASAVAREKVLADEKREATAVGVAREKWLEKAATFRQEAVCASNAKSIEEASKRFLTMHAATSHGAYPEFLTLVQVGAGPESATPGTHFSRPDPSQPAVEKVLAFCGACGEQNAGSNFCPFCGAAAAAPAGRVKT
jgi:hypothetical protein